MGPVRRAKDDQIRLTLLGQGLEGVRRGSLLDVHHLEVAAIVLDDSLRQHARVLATLVLQISDDDLGIDGDASAIGSVSLGRTSPRRD